MNHPAPNHPKRVSDRDRAAQAVEMRADGHQWQTIADQLGYYDDRAACRAVQRVLDRTESVNADALRSILTDRYEGLYRRAVDAFDQATTSGREVGRAQLLAAARSALDSLAKVHGLDRPTAEPAPAAVAAVEAIDLEIAALASAIREKGREETGGTVATPTLDGLAALAELPAPEPEEAP